MSRYDLGAGDGPDWSPDGHRLLFRTAADQEADTATTDIAIVRADGSDRRRLTHSDEPGQVLSSSFSPDGDWIVYAARGTADRFDLYIMRTDGSASRPLTRTELWDSAPEWGAG